jgi:putative hydroxymethylpyrimidine transport system permease protein
MEQDTAQAAAFLARTPFWASMIKALKSPFGIRISASLGALALILALWQAAILIFRPAPFILPGPLAIALALSDNAAYLAGHAATTLGEMLLGLLFGSSAGIALALVMAQSRLAERLLLPMIVTTQTLPVFAIAPLIVIWFGFGMPSKVVMASLIIFFPVASAFFDGLSRTRPEWLDLARSWGASRSQLLFKVRIPGALPSLATGLKLAATVAPIGAIVGEWAGASAGLGYVMLQANARSQPDMVFACLVILALIAWCLRAAVSAAADRLLLRNE